MKKIFFIIVAIGIVLFGTLFAVAGHQEQQTQALIDESKVLSASGKYTDALNTLIKAKNRDPSDGLTSIINEEIKRNEPLIRSQEYFNKGKNAYDKREYEEAIGFFKLVSQNDTNFIASQTYIELATNKLAGNQKGSIAGVTTIIQPSSVPDKVENLEVLCEADVSSFKSKAALQFDQMIRKSISDHSDTYNDPIWGPLTDAKFSDMKKQYDANINNVVGLMKIWCLEHNRDYSDFKAPEVNYVF